MGKVAPRELMHAGYESLDSLSGLSARELLKIHGVGPKAIRVANEALVDRGLPPICE
jgi:hypothetical protein